MLVHRIDYDIILSWDRVGRFRWNFFYLFARRIDVWSDWKIFNIRVVHSVSSGTQSSISLNYRVIALFLSIPPVLSYDLHFVLHNRLNLSTSSISLNLNLPKSLEQKQNLFSFSLVVIPRKKGEVKIIIR